MSKCIRGRDLPSVSTMFLSDFGSVPTVWYFLEVFRQCGIFWKCSDSVVFFGSVPTVWYFIGSVPTVWYFLEVFRQCGIFFSVPTVWYFLERFRQCGIFCFPFYIYVSSHTILYMLVFMFAWSSWNHMFSKQHNS
jgi:hypothetical protein